MRSGNLEELGRGGTNEGKFDEEDTKSLLLPKNTPPLDSDPPPLLPDPRIPPLGLHTSEQTADELCSPQ